MVPIFCCSFECGAAGGHVTSFGGAYSTANPKDGLRTWRSNVTAAAGWGQVLVGPTASITVARIYVYFTSLPSANCDIFSISKTIAAGVVFKQSDSKLYAGSRSGGGVLSFGATGVSVTTGQWYLLDVKVDATSGTYTIDVQVDGVACAQTTASSTASTSCGVIVGNITAVTVNMDFDSLLISGTSGDYPLGGGKVLSYVPNADGTHTSTSTNIVKGTAASPTGGGAITSATSDAFNWVNARPIGGGATDATRLINQQTASSTQYVEVDFESTLETSAPRAVEVITADQQAATQTCNFQTKLNDNGTEDAIVNRGTVAGVVTDRFATKQYATMPADSGAWTLIRFNALKARFGYSSDATPDVYWRGIMIEAEFAPAAGNNTATPGTKSLTTTKFAPVLQTVVTPATKTLATSPFAPQLKQTVTPSTKALVTTKFAPTIVNPQGMSVPTKALTLSTFAPALKTVVTPAVKTVATSAFAPQLKTSVTPATKALSLSTFAPTLIRPQTASPGTLSLTVTTFAPTALVGNTVVPGTASLSLNTFGPTLKSTITVGTKSLVTSTFAPVLKGSVIPSSKTLTINSFAPTLIRPNTVTPGTLVLSLTTFVPTAGSSNATTVTPGTKALSITRYAPALASQIPIPNATLALTGFAPVLRTTTSPSTKSLVITTHAPSVQVASSAVTVTPQTLVLTLTTHAPFPFILVAGSGVAVPPAITRTTTTGASSHASEINAQGRLSSVVAASNRTSIA